MLVTRGLILFVSAVFVLASSARADIVSATILSTSSGQLSSYAVPDVPDPLLVVWTFSDDRAAQPTAVAWGPSSLTFAQNAVQGSGEFSTSASIWYLRNPSPGTEDLVATKSSGAMLMVAAVFDDVADMAPELAIFDTPPSGGGSFLEFTTLSDAALIVSVGGTRDAVPGNTSGGTVISTGSAAGGGYGMSYGYGGVSGLHASSWEMGSGSTGRWVHVVAVFTAASPMQCPWEATATDVIVPDAHGVIDLAAEYGVQCDGSTDDGPAIVDAIEEAQTPHGSEARRVIKFPAGVCLSSQQLEWRDVHGHPSAQLTMVGAGESLTTLQATDNNPLFQDPNSPEWFIKTRSQWPCENACGFRNSFKHMTISTGSGNPGAIALDYEANNTGTIEDVTIRSEDGQGSTGLSMTRSDPGPALIDNVTIEGFDLCANLGGGFNYSMTAVDLHCVDAPIIVDESSFALLRFSGPSIETASSSAMILLSDSQLTGNGAVGIAGPGSYAVRKVSALGFDNAAGSLGQCAAEGYSDVSMAFSGSPSSHIGIPWQDPPEPLRSDNPQHWASIQDYGTGRPGLLNVLNSLRPIVYAFDDGGYTGSYSIPPHVRLITGLGHSIGSGDVGASFLVVDQPSLDPLVIEFFNSGVSQGEKAIHVTAARPVYVRNANLGRDAIVRVEAGAGPVWLDDVSMGHLSIEDATVYARQLNIEGRTAAPGGEAHIRCDGCRLLVYGYKHESVIGSARVVNGGCAEIYGAHVYPVTQFDTPEEIDTPMWEVVDSSLTVSYQETAYESDRHFPVVLRETRGAVTEELLHEDMLSRGHGTKSALVSAWDGSGCGG